MSRSTLRKNELYNILGDCCQCICRAEKPGLTMDDIQAIDEDIEILVNDLVASKHFKTLKDQLLKTLGILEESKPKDWKQDKEVLQVFLGVVSETIYMG